MGGGPPGFHGLIALSPGVFGTTALTWTLMALASGSSGDDRPGDPDRP